AHLASLIADLDSNQFAVREKAARDLERLGDSATAALREKLKDKPPMQTQQRINALLKNLCGLDPSPGQLRIMRAVQVLEYIGDAEARKLLTKLSEGAPQARLTQEAKASLERLAKRPVAAK